MAAPRPLAMTSRLNTGGYGVTVHGTYLIRGERGEVGHFQHVSGVEESVERIWLALDPEQFKVCRVSGTVASDGSLSIQPELWAARHYRRAVMRGAGVYRWGLWAFLGAGRATGALQLLTVPRGEHVEPHRVIVRGRDVLAPELTHLDVGNVTPDQGFTLAGYRQRAVYYRQAVMRGAGVYQEGLWAMLAGKRYQHDPAQVVESQEAALGVNGAEVLDRFTRAAHGRVRHSVRWRTARKWRERRAYMARVFVHCEAVAMDAGRRLIRGWSLRKAVPRRTWRRYTSRITEIEQRERRLRDLLPAADHDYHTNGIDPSALDGLLTIASDLKRGNFERLYLDKLSSLFKVGTVPFLLIMQDGRALKGLVKCIGRARRTLAPLLAQIIKRGDLYRAHLARIVKPQRAPRRIPRPLYSRAIPPAAPLAPPALA